MPSLFSRPSLSFIRATNDSSLVHSSAGSHSNGIDFPTSMTDLHKNTSTNSHIDRVPTSSISAQPIPPLSYSPSPSSSSHTHQHVPVSSSPKPTTTGSNPNPGVRLIRKVSTIIKSRASNLSSSTSSSIIRSRSRSIKLSNASAYGAPVGNIPIKNATIKSSSSSSSWRKRKPVPFLSSSEEKGGGAGRGAGSERAINEEDGDEDYIDEIRRPSGLGDSVSIRSFKIVPMTAGSSSCGDDNTTEDGGPGSFAGMYDSDGRKIGDRRPRVSSTPNLLSSYKWRGEINLPGIALARRSILLPFKKDVVGSEDVYPQETITLPELPVEVVEVILSFLPRYTVAQLARVSRLYRSASRTVLYKHLDLSKLSPRSARTLLSVLASHSHIAELVHSFHCPTWLATPQRTVTSPSSPSSTPEEILPYALERMGGLTSLSLPEVQPSILRHHSAFGLTHLSFHMREMDPALVDILLSWLNGQVNITSLSFPNLEDKAANPTTTSSSSHFLSLSYHSRSVTLPNLNTETLQPPNVPSFLTPSSSPFASPNTSPLSTTFPSPSSPTSSNAFPTAPSSTSPTLLPSLTFLQAPVSLIEILAPSRPLKHAFINVDISLYSGLRPSKLMNSVRGVTSLGIRFGEKVDRRTLEKLLGAVGGILGNSTPPLEHLEIHVYFHDPGSEDVFYKSLHTVLPRCKHLKTLKLVRLPPPLHLPHFSQHASDVLDPTPSPTPTNPPSDNPSSSRRRSLARIKVIIPRSSPPISPLPPLPQRPSPHTHTHNPARRSISLKTPTRDRFGADSYSPLSITSPPSPFVDYATALTEHDQLNLSLWLQQAPSLDKVTLLSNGVWEREE